MYQVFPNFQEKNANRDYRVFEELYYHIVNKATKMFGLQRINKDLPIIKIIDSTMIDLPFNFVKKNFVMIINRNVRQLK